MNHFFRSYSPETLKTRRGERTIQTEERIIVTDSQDDRNYVDVRTKKTKD